MWRRNVCPNPVCLCCALTGWFQQQVVGWPAKHNLQQVRSESIPKDKDGSGELSLPELMEGARTDPQFHSRLRVMDIEARID